MTATAIYKFFCVITRNVLSQMIHGYNEDVYSVLNPQAYPATLVYSYAAQGCFVFTRTDPGVDIDNTLMVHGLQIVAMF